MARHRMLLSLDDELYNALKELSEEAGVPAATFVVQLLESSKPQIEAITAAVRLAKQQPAGALDKLNEMVTSSLKDINTLQGNIKRDKNNLK